LAPRPWPRTRHSLSVGACQPQGAGNAARLRNGDPATRSAAAASVPPSPSLGSFSGPSLAAPHPWRTPSSRAASLHTRGPPASPAAAWTASVSSTAASRERRRVARSTSLAATGASSGAFSARTVPSTASRASRAALTVAGCQSDKAFASHASGAATVDGQRRLTPSALHRSLSSSRAAVSGCFRRLCLHRRIFTPFLLFSFPSHIPPSEFALPSINALLLTFELFKITKFG
jgi:hypothetical protein